MLARFLISLIVFSGVSLVQASLYINDPVASTTCYGGQACTVTWLDDGEEPLLADIGACYVGLFTGDGTLIQQIEPVNVGVTRTLTFTPDPAAGPDSSDYYLNFTSVTYKVNGSTPFIGYSADFTLTDMTGSLASPVASDTATIAVPSSVLSPSSDSILSTSTVVNTYSYSSYSALPLSLPTSSVSSYSTLTSGSSTAASSTSSSAVSSSTTSSSASSSATRSLYLPTNALWLASVAGLILSYPALP